MAQVLLLFSGEEGERPAVVRIFCHKAVARRAGHSRAPCNSPFLREEVAMFIVTEAAGGYRKAVRSIFGPRPSKARSSPGSTREQARSQLCAGGPAQVEHRALASLFHKFYNTIGEIKIFP